MRVEKTNPTSLCVLTVNTTDAGGGAEAIAVGLAMSYRAMGLGSYLAVGYQKQTLKGTVLLAEYNYPGVWKPGWRLLAARGRSRTHNERSIVESLAQFAGRCIAKPVRRLKWELGHEDFDFPSTWRLLSLPPQRPDILHIHNPHGGFFDLRALGWLSGQVPTVLTLHDAWTISGHCAHSFDCERWRTGCGSCPDLTIPPLIRRDGTRYNWKRKQRIYQKSRLYVATPSRWLMSKVEESILAPAIVESRVIPNGIDLNIFRPGNRMSLRTQLGIPPKAKVILLAANRIRNNPWKDYQTFRRTFEILSARLPNSDLLFIGLGEDAPAQRLGRAELRFVPYQNDPDVVVRYYQAADVYAHAAHADTFPNTVLEALACGTPVVATAVGGIPEQVKGLLTDGVAFGSYGCDEATGFLVGHGDSVAMAAGIERLLDDDELRSRLSDNATRDVRARFNRDQQTEAYLTWYQEIRAKHS